MALNSMTGFGKADGKIRGCSLSAELRTVNNRYLEIQFRLPRILSPFESELRVAITNRIQRGSMTCSFNMCRKEEEEIPDGFREDVVENYLKMADSLAKKYDLEGKTLLSDVLHLPGIVKTRELDAPGKGVLKSALGILEKALDQLVQMRAREAANLKKDMVRRLRVLNRTLKDVEKLVPQRLKYYQKRLDEKVQVLLGDVEIDSSRMAQEISLLADKQDITEEIVRFRSHNEIFLETLNAEGPHGKRLNFILQEMAREANTLGTKSQYVEISHLAVVLKEEVENLREQVMNIE